MHVYVKRSSEIPMEMWRLLRWKVISPGLLGAWQSYFYLCHDVVPDRSSSGVETLAFAHSVSNEVLHSSWSGSRCEKKELIMVRKTWKPKWLMLELYMVKKVVGKVADGYGRIVHNARELQCLKWNAVEGVWSRMAGKAYRLMWPMTTVMGLMGH